MEPDFGDVVKSYKIIVARDTVDRPHTDFVKPSEEVLFFIGIVQTCWVRTAPLLRQLG